MRYLISLIIIGACLTSCKSTPKKAKEDNSTKTAEQATSDSITTKQSSAITAYYFHNTRRCVTCETVEKVATEALKAKNIGLKSINLEEEDGKNLAKSLEVSGQTLLIVAGDKKENLTNFAFLNARSNPELLKAKINSVIDDFNK